MTNYNERLDEILAELLWCDKSKAHLVQHYTHRRGNHRAGANAKAVITSLIKELVAEAKPFDYVPEGHQPEACLNHEKYTSACCGCRNQRARVHALDEFEQNLLKALEEK